MKLVTRGVLAVLCNLEQSCVGLRLGALTVAAWPYGKLLNRLARIEEDETWHVDISLDFENGVLRAGNMVLVAAGQMLWPDEDQAAPDADRNAIWMAQHRVFEEIENYARCLRLYAEGHAAIRAIYIYKRIGRRPELIQSTKHLRPVEDHPFELDSIASVESFVRGGNLLFSQEFVHLAWENFEQSFEVEDVKLKFLLLMIAMEILFNDGQQELRYKVARASAVVLGSDEQHSREVFERVKKLYDKRSQLVHTGRPGSVTLEDVVELRRFARSAIRCVNRLDVAKEELMRMVTESGFGGFGTRASGVPPNNSLQPTPRKSSLSRSNPRPRRG